MPTSPHPQKSTIYNIYSKLIGSCPNQGFYLWTVKWEKPTFPKQHNLKVNCLVLHPSLKLSLCFTFVEIVSFAAVSYSVLLLTDTGQITPAFLICSLYRVYILPHSSGYIRLMKSSCVCRHIPDDVTNHRIFRPRSCWFWTTLKLRGPWISGFNLHEV